MSRLTWSPVWRLRQSQETIVNITGKLTSVAKASLLISKSVAGQHPAWQQHRYTFYIGLFLSIAFYLLCSWTSCALPWCVSALKTCAGLDWSFHELLMYEYINIHNLIKKKVEILLILRWL